MENVKAQIQEFKAELPITIVELPEGHSLNDMWLNYGADGISELISETPKGKVSSNTLVVTGESKIQFKGKAGSYSIVGSLPKDMSNMRISLLIVANDSPRKHRLKIDLFDTSNVEDYCNQLSEKYQFDYHLLEADLFELTDLLEHYRDELFNSDGESTDEVYPEKIKPKAEEAAVDFLSKPQLMKNIDKLLEQSGIIGEENNRKLLFTVASSFKMPYPLHAMVQASSGSGKSHLINSIAECMPQDELFDTTSITSKSLYYCTDKQLNNKLLVIQDWDGLDDDAKFALREIQSYKKLTRTTVEKSALGNRKTVRRSVNANLASLIATTQEVYQDNESRTIMLSIDESIEQTLRIIQRQNQRKSGVVSSDKELEAKQFLRNCIRILKPYKVINPFADKIDLPLDAKMLRRLNEQFQDFICQITLLHQYQRKTDVQGRLIATKDDVKLAVEIFFDAIIFKVDELNGNTRQFFDKLKEYVKQQPSGSTHKFTQREIRQYTKLSNTPVSNYIKQLLELEYIQISSGSVNQGYQYMITYWDNLEKLKTKIKQDLNEQLKQL